MGAWLVLSGKRVKSLGAWLFKKKKEEENESQKKKEKKKMKDRKKKKKTALVFVTIVWAHGLLK